MKFFEKLMWLPLASIIFGAYAIQRGLVVFAKTDLVAPWLSEALHIYFLMIALSIFFAGVFLDKIPTRKALLGAVITGTVGLLTLPYTPWGFGILLGVAAAFIKLGPFSGPLKILSGGKATSIVPQAIAKNVGALVFLLVLASVLTGLGWTVTALAMTAIFLGAGITSYILMPDDNLETKWKLDKFVEWAKDYRFWFFIGVFFCQGIYYPVMSQFWPQLAAAGYGSSKPFLLGGGFVLAGLLRYPWARIGDKVGHWPLLLIASFGYILTFFFSTVAPLAFWIGFQCIASIQTPCYWGYARRFANKDYVATLVGVGFVVLYVSSWLLWK